MKCTRKIRLIGRVLIVVLATAIVGTILVSLVTRPYDKERLRGLVCWIPAKQEPTE